MYRIRDVMHSLFDQMRFAIQLELALRHGIVVSTALSLFFNVNGKYALFVDKIANDSWVVDHIDGRPILEIQAHTKIVKLELFLLEL